jgi:hypothetical protein
LISLWHAFELNKAWPMHGVLMRYNDRCPSGQEKK